MPETTPEMNSLAVEHMNYLAERRLGEIEQSSFETSTIPYTGIHSGLGPPDMSLKEAVDHLRTVPVSYFFDHEPCGWYEENCAWFMLFPKSTQPDGTVFRLRTTLIMLKNAGEWKAVHWHVSEPVDRAAAFGEVPRV